MFYEKVFQTKKIQVRVSPWDALAYFTCTPLISNYNITPAFQPVLALILLLH